MTVTLKILIAQVHGIIQVKSISQNE